MTSSYATSVKTVSSTSNADLRKIKKPLIERKRRERINHCLNEIKSLVLEATYKDEACYAKMEKADILEMTVSHLKQLKKQPCLVDRNKGNTTFLPSLPTETAKPSTGNNIFANATKCIPVNTYNANNIRYYDNDNSNYRYNNNLPDFKDINYIDTYSNRCSCNSKNVNDQKMDNIEGLNQSKSYSNNHFKNVYDNYNNIKLICHNNDNFKFNFNKYIKKNISETNQNCFNNATLSPLNFNNENHNFHNDIQNINSHPINKIQNVHTEQTFSNMTNSSINSKIKTCYDNIFDNNTDDCSHNSGFDMNPEENSLISYKSTSKTNLSYTFSNQFHNMQSKVKSPSISSPLISHTKYSLLNSFPNYNVISPGLDSKEKFSYDFKNFDSIDNCNIINSNFNFSSHNNTREFNNRISGVKFENMNNSNPTSNIIKNFNHLSSMKNKSSDFLYRTEMSKYPSNFEKKKSNNKETSIKTEEPYEKYELCCVESGRVIKCSRGFCDVTNNSAFIKSQKKLNKINSNDNKIILTGNVLNRSEEYKNSIEPLTEALYSKNKNNSYHFIQFNNKNKIKENSYEEDLLKIKTNKYLMNKKSKKSKDIKKNRNYSSLEGIPSSQNLNAKDDYLNRESSTTPSYSRNNKMKNSLENSPNNLGLFSENSNFSNVKPISSINLKDKTLIFSSNSLNLIKKLPYINSLTLNSSPIEERNVIITDELNIHQEKTISPDKLKNSSKPLDLKVISSTENQILCDDLTNNSKNLKTLFLNFQNGLNFDKFSILLDKNNNFSVKTDNTHSIQNSEKIFFREKYKSEEIFFNDNYEKNYGIIFNSDSSYSPVNFNSYSSEKNIKNVFKSEKLKETEEVSAVFQEQIENINTSNSRSFNFIIEKIYNENLLWRPW